MSLIGELKSGYRVLREEGFSNMMREGFYFGYEKSVRTLNHYNGKSSQGENIYERDWDVMIILDACRYDLLDMVKHEYEFIRSVEKFHSLGSHSAEWMNANFTDGYNSEMSKTSMITGNPFTDYCLDKDDFFHMDEMWRYAWDDEIGTMPPKPLTDHAINQWKTQDSGRMIVHYMQPHIPFLNAPEMGRGQTTSEWGNLNRSDVWRQVRMGKVSAMRAHEEYKQNLHAVLDSVDVLINNIDAETVIITADHGNALGEKLFYGHPPGVTLDCIRKVPWAVTSAEDTDDYSPKNYHQSNSGDVAERLDALGYTS